MAYAGPLQKSSSNADNITNAVNPDNKKSRMTRKKIGDILVDQGFIGRDELEEALKQQSATGKRLGDILIEKKLVTEDELVYAISERLEIQRISLGSLVIDPQVIRKVPVDVARRYTVIPVFSIGKTLTVAMADPLNIIAIDHIKYSTGADIKRVVAGASEIREAIDQYYSVADSLVEIVASRQATVDPTAAAVAASTHLEADSPIVKLVNVIITKAVKEGASDVHIEPDETSLRIRYRISGVMHEEASPPKSMQSEVISRIKIAADLDVSERRLPQDGRFMTLVDDAPIDLRVSTLPTIHGEKIVIRILDRRNLTLSFSQLGFGSELEESWTEIVRKPEGLILICGPTSSGKTSTLYATLQDINSIEKNIVTVEDPVEYSLPLINQIQINEKAGLNFPSTMRSILRQNPDIIMVGEIRDRETAQMAVRAALTGHLVFSTVHTNDAPTAITRLIDMGLEEYLVAAALKGVLAQRLVRVNCPECLEEYQPSEVLLRRAGIAAIRDKIRFKRGAGCRLCNNTGFRGLTGVYEFFRITPDISELILSGTSLNIVRDKARQQGFTTLFEAGMGRVATGDVCLEELLKETSSAEDYVPENGSVEANIPDAGQVNVGAI